MMRSCRLESLCKCVPHSVERAQRTPGRATRDRPPFLRECGRLHGSSDPSGVLGREPEVASRVERAGHPHRAIPTRRGGAVPVALLVAVVDLVVAALCRTATDTPVIHTVDRADSCRGKTCATAQWNRESEPVPMIQWRHRPRCKRSHCCFPRPTTVNRVPVLPRPHCIGYCYCCSCCS